MEAFYDKKNKEDREAKKLTQLARYRHDLKQEKSGSVQEEEEEEEEIDLCDDKDQLSPEEYLDYAERHLRAQT